VTKEKLRRLIELAPLENHWNQEIRFEFQRLMKEFEAWEPNKERDEAEKRESLLADGLEEATRYGAGALKAIDEARHWARYYRARFWDDPRPKPADDEPDWLADDD